MKKHFVFILALCNWAYAQEGGHARSFSPNVPDVSNTPLLKQVLTKGAGQLARWRSEESNLATPEKEAIEETSPISSRNSEEAPRGPINSPINQDRMFMDYPSAAAKLTTALVRLAEKYAPQICPSPS